MHRAFYRFARTTLAMSVAVALFTHAAVSEAQPGGLPTAPAPSESPDKPKGVAEAAPKAPGLLPTTPVLPPVRERSKKFRLVELDGYLRLRTDWFKRFHLGFFDDPTKGGAPFPRPLGCQARDDNDNLIRPCDDKVGTANMRLRLEPTFHVSESATIYTQIDMLDNAVLGSTPFRDGQPVGGFVDSVDAPSDSVKVKRAWGAVYTPLALVEFGRMPEHWGLGMVYNSGSRDPVHDTYDYEADFGDTVDRIAISNTIPGTNLRGMIAIDWPFGGPSSDQDATGAGYGQGWDLDNNDDSKQWTIAVSRLDTPREFRDRVVGGKLGLNYGLHLAFRKQSWDSVVDPGDVRNSSDLVPRDASAFVPDAWLRIGRKNLSLELEAAAVFGSIDSLSDLGVAESVDVFQLGAVARFGAHWLDEKLKLGFETGYASGDSADAAVPGNVHISRKAKVPAAGDDTFTLFAFDRNYRVDYIYFSQLAGAVHNALYLRPSLSYDLTRNIRGTFANITSFAARPVATPGNEAPLGTEFNLGVSFEGESFSLGLGYGLFVPFAGLDHPDDGTGGSTFGFTPDNVGEAENAQTFQMRFGLRF